MKKVKKVLSGIMGVLAVAGVGLLMCLPPYAFWPLRSILFYGMLFIIFYQLMRPRQVQPSDCCCRANLCGGRCCASEEIHDEININEK